MQSVTVARRPVFPRARPPYGAATVELALFFSLLAIVLGALFVSLLPAMRDLSEQHARVSALAVRSLSVPRLIITSSGSIPPGLDQDDSLPFPGEGFLASSEVLALHVAHYQIPGSLVAAEFGTGSEVTGEETPTAWCLNIVKVKPFPLIATDPWYDLLYSSESLENPEICSPCVLTRLNTLAQLRYGEEHLSSELTVNSPTFVAVWVDKLDPSRCALQVIPAGNLSVFSPPFQIPQGEQSNEADPDP